MSDASKGKRKIVIESPQFDREPGAPPARRPPRPFDSIRALGYDDLVALGCRPWEHTPRGTILLFPAEWYESIPEGFSYVDINGRIGTFKKGKTDDDRRMGVLAFGVVRRKPMGTRRA